MNMKSEDYSASEDAYLYTAAGKKEGGRCDGKRRFSEEQIKSLESMFESQAKLEPRKKLQLARELGLQPRQVAIWFQNKRARWKSKQLERRYDALRADYDALLSNFDKLKAEKLILVKNLQKLTQLLKRTPDGSSNDGESENDDNGRGNKTREDIEDTTPGRQLSTEDESDTRVMMDPDDKDKKLIRIIANSDEEDKQLNYIGQDEAELLYFGEPVSNSGYFTSTERRCSFDGSCPLEKCCSSASQWWEFWPLTE